MLSAVVQSLGILEVDLVLALSHLVVAGLDLKSHLLQRYADLAAGTLAVVQGAQVEVAGLVVGLGGGLALLVGLEQEELSLGAHVEGVIAHVGGLLQHPLQHAAGVAYEGSAVGIVDVADESGHLTVLRPPGEHNKGVQVGIEVLVRLVDADKAFDGRAIQHDLVVDGLLDLGGGNGHVLELAENIGELHADEFDVLFLYDTDDVFLGVRHGGYPLSSLKYTF